MFQNIGAQDQIVAFRKRKSFRMVQILPDDLRVQPIGHLGEEWILFQAGDILESTFPKGLTDVPVGDAHI